MIKFLLFNLTFFPRYEGMESTRLSEEMEAFTSTSKDILDELRNIASSVPKLMSSFTAASNRCCRLSEGCVYPGLLEAFKDCLGKYLERFGNLMRRLEKRKAAAHSWNILQQVHKKYYSID